MASFGKKVRLMQKSLNRKFVGISPDKCEENVIITFDNSITVYDTSNKRVVKSWSVGKGQSITSPTIYNKDDDEYVFVVNKNIIHTNSGSNFDKTEKFTVSCDIHSILPDCDDESFVIFTNGQTTNLTKVFADPKFSPNPSKFVLNDEKIIKCQLVELAQKYLVLLCGSDTNYFLAIINISNNGSAEGFRIPVEFKNYRLCSACFHVQNNSATTLATLWNNNVLCTSIITSQCLQLKSLEFTKVANIVVPENISFSLMSFVSDDLVAVVCEKDENTIVSVHDLKFGLCHGKISGVSESTQIESLNSHLVLIEDKEISSVSFTTNSVNLLTAFKKNSSISTSRPSQALWTTQNAEVEEKNSTIEKHVNVLLNSTKIEEIKKSWKLLWKKQNTSQQKVFALSSVMSQLLSRITDDILWCPGLVEEVVSTGFISSSVSPQLVGKVLKHKDLCLLSVCLKHVRNIPERDIVSCLNFILKCEENEMEINEQKQDEDFLLSILTLPFTEAQMKEELRHLSFKKVLVLLENLNARLKFFSFEHDRVVGFDQIMCWVCLLLDAHFTQFVISPDAWEVLVALQETVGCQVEVFDEVHQINILLTKIKESLKRSQKPKHFMYRVDVMTI